MAGRKSERLWFDHALLPSGWASGVVITVSDGLILDVSVGVVPPSGAVRGRSVLPGLANLHSHAFQRAMSGRTEVRGMFRTVSGLGGVCSIALSAGLDRRISTR